MNWLRFSIRSLLVVTFICAFAVVIWPRPNPNAPDPAWRDLLFENSMPLANVPEIEVKSTQGGSIWVTAKNTGSTTLQYYSAGKSHIQLFQETHDGTKWTNGGWDWCGTGKELFEIAPDESVDLKLNFWLNDQPVRMLAVFSEKNTERSGFVVLASQDLAK